MTKMAANRNYSLKPRVNSLSSEFFFYLCLNVFLLKKASMLYWIK